jgi:hypothetical protein
MHDVLFIFGYEPALQREHEIEPDLDEIVPFSHGIHDEFVILKCVPAGQL